MKEYHQKKRSYTLIFFFNSRKQNGYYQELCNNKVTLCSITNRLNNTLFHETWINATLNNTVDHIFQ